MVLRGHLIQVTITNEKVSHFKTSHEGNVLHLFWFACIMPTNIQLISVDIYMTFDDDNRNVVFKSSHIFSSA